jgi:hypothetical protein
MKLFNKGIKMNQAIQTKDLSQSLDSISTDKLNKIQHIVRDRIDELKQEVIDSQEYLAYIQYLIDKNSFKEVK